MRIHTVPKGTINRPQPTLRDERIHTYDKRLPGGLPPQPYRSATPRWATASVARFALGR
jgi:hypothetical protein